MKEKDHPAVSSSWLLYLNYVDVKKDLNYSYESLKGIKSRSSDPVIS